MIDQQQMYQKAIMAFLSGTSCSSGVLIAAIPDLDFYVRCTVGFFSICGVLMSMRYYHFATKEKKEALKRYENTSSINSTPDSPHRQ